MLTKNVYILYPAGYSGSYIHWAINITDYNNSQFTIKDPINSSDSKKFGGIGTSHLHTRIPSHQGLMETLHWKIVNKDNDTKIYLINIHPDRDNAKIIKELMMSDPTGIFINIHDNSDFLIQSYGFINCVIKWPSFLYVTAFNNFKLHEQFDIFNCKDDIIFRNYCVENMNILCNNPPIDFLQLTEYLKRRKEWFNRRSSLQYHEINENYYITNYEIENRIFELSCYDIVTDKFPNILKNIFLESNLSNNFDFDYLENFHYNYIKSQKNLQWFESFNKWQRDGVIDDYLNSHSIIAAILINFMIHENKTLTTINWKKLSLDNLNKIYQSLKTKYSLRTVREP